MAVTFAPFCTAAEMLLRSQFSDSAAPSAALPEPAPAMVMVTICAEVSEVAGREPAMPVVSAAITS